MKFVDEKIEEYAISKSTRPSNVADELERYTRENVEMSMMLIGKMEASFLGLLLKTIGGKRVLEFGTYTGYSALCMAENLPSDGEVHTIDINPETVNAGKEIWGKSEHASKITTHFGEGLAILPSLEGEFDLVFIDADKENYLNYLKASLERLSSNGMIVLDNTLWSGKVLESDVDASTKGIQEVNDFIANDPNLTSSLLPIRDGMHLVIKNK